METGTLTVRWNIYKFFSHCKDNVTGEKRRSLYRVNSRER